MTAKARIQSWFKLLIAIVINVLSVARLIRQTRRARAMIEAMDARAAAARVRNRAQTGASSAFARAETGERNKQSLLRK